MAAPVTLLIPTHERPGYLRRALSYYRDVDAQILVADSSLAPFGGPTSPRVRYLHFPGQDFMPKLGQVLEHLATPYVVFCADDDFTVPRAMLACLDFLEANPGYVSAQGDYYRAELGPGGVRTQQIYAQSRLVRVDSDSPAERLLQAQSPYIPTFYAVQRTGLLRDFVRLYGTGLGNYNLLEFCSTVLGAIHGKHKQLPLFYGVRESVPSQSPKDPRRRDGIEVVSRAPRYATEYALFLDRTAAALAGLHGLAQDQARAAVQAAVDAFVANYCQHTPRRSFVQKLPKYARRALDAVTGRDRKAEEALHQELVLAQALEEQLSGYDSQARAEYAAIQALMAGGPG